MYGKTYIAIDLKAFYASAECHERGLNPFKTNLVVADTSRSEKTICLAVSPYLKKYGVSSRARLFEVNAILKEINKERKKELNIEEFAGKSYIQKDIDDNPYLEISYLAAPPSMRLYIEYSTKIYNIYLNYVSKKDIYVYSIDEVFIDATDYLKKYNIPPKKLAKCIISDIFYSTGISSTAGIGTNLYLCKIAMDIGAKKVKPDVDGVRIAELDEISYRKFLWDYEPITDFWRIGPGNAKKLKNIGIHTMKDIAKCSLGGKDDFYNSKLLFELFGINADVMIDHAWGIEPVELEDVKNYRPDNESISSGQVLFRPYKFCESRLILKEMCEGLALELFSKKILTKQIVISVRNDIENIEKGYVKKTKKDCYGRIVPKKVRATINFENYTNSIKKITEELINWFDIEIDRNMTIRKFNLSANCLIRERKLENNNDQINVFELVSKEKNSFEKKESNIQKLTLKIHNKFGKNSLLKGIDLEDSATKIQRNDSIGGHKA